jgi:hypothetical protein
MVITLTPEIETDLNELAEKQGTTIELLALRTLRECLSVLKAKSVRTKTDRHNKAETLADFLRGYIGVFDSSEFVMDGAQMSVNTGKKFADILLEKRRRGHL